jgi:hypothetical protein
LQATAPSSAWSLTVIAGPHRCAVIDVQGDVLHFGKALDNDFVTGDDLAEPRLGTFAYANGKLHLCPEASGLRLDGAMLSPGVPVRLRDGMVLSFGRTSLRIDRSTEPPQPVNRVLLGGATVAAIALIAGSWLLVPAGSAAFKPLRPPAPGPAAPPIPKVTAAQIAGRLRTQLAKLRLGKQITLQTRPGMVTASGLLGIAQRSSWQGAQRWFDAHAQGRVMLLNRVKILPAQVPAPAALGAVFTGPRPSLVTADGRHYGIGTVMPEGWTVTRIGQHAVTFTRNGMRVRERY